MCGSGVAAAWRESGLSWAEFLPGSTEVAVDQFVADNKLEWTAAAASPEVDTTIISEGGKLVLGEIMGISFEEFNLPLHPPDLLCAGGRTGQG